MIQKQAEAVEALTGNATSVGEISVSRIDEPAVCEQFLAWFECRPAAGISAARVGAENESLYGRSMVDSCRVPRRSLSLCTLLGAAVSLIDERRRCWESCFPFARMVCPRYVAASYPYSRCTARSAGHRASRVRLARVQARTRSRSQASRRCH
jgi:hypothetical protein